MALAPNAYGPAIGYDYKWQTGFGISNADGTAKIVAGASGMVLTGTLTTSGVLTLPAGTAAAPSFGFTGSTTTGPYLPATGVFGLAIAGVAGLAIAGSSPTLAAATDTAGQDVYIKAAAAGGTATAARVGGLLNIAAGAGSAGSSGTGTVDSGTGGALALVAGAGGSATSTAGAQGGVGGAASLTAGAGGSAAGTDPGGAGGAVSVVAGAGGAKTGTGAAAGGAGGATSLTGGAGGATASSGTDAGGAGGTVAIAGGAGGAASAGTGNGGAGGAVTIIGGAGGTSAGGTAGARGAVTIQGLRTTATTSTAITGATTLVAADSNGIFTVAQSSAYQVTLPTPAGAGVRYTLQLVSPGAFNVTVVATGCTFEGTIVNDVTSVLPATGSTFTFASGTAALGDNIEFISTSASKYFARAVSSAAGGITIA